MLQLSPTSDPRIMGSGNHYDDAVVVRLNESTTLVQTVDFFTPVVDDAYWYGRIAAANSLSDVYAMGGRPVTAMNIVCFPIRTLGPDQLVEILRGAQDTLDLARVMLAGGHTVEDAEPKFGLAVTGVVDPHRVTYKGGLRPGQQLWLTKPIGSGVITTAHKRDLIPPEELQVSIEWMAQLNDIPCTLMVELGCAAATDITGFGLLGHAMEMARASGLRVHFQADRVPLLPRAAELLAGGAFPGGSQANRVWLEKSGQLSWGDDVSELQRDLLCDAQTSGGLLLGLDAEAGRLFEVRMSEAGRQAWCVGSTRTGESGIEVSR